MHILGNCKIRPTNEYLCLKSGPMVLTYTSLKIAILLHGCWLHHQSVIYNNGFKTHSLGYYGACHDTQVHIC